MQLKSVLPYELKGNIIVRAEDTENAVFFALIYYVVRDVTHLVLIDTISQAKP